MIEDIPSASTNAVSSSVGLVEPRIRDNSVAVYMPERLAKTRATCGRSVDNGSVSMSMTSPRSSSLVCVMWAMLAITKMTYANAERIDPMDAGLPTFWNTTMYTDGIFLRPAATQPADCIYAAKLEVAGCDFVSVGCHCYQWRLIQADTFSDTCAVTAYDPVVHVAAQPGPCAILVRWGLQLRSDVELVSPFCLEDETVYDGPVALCEQVFAETVTFAAMRATKNKNTPNVGLVSVVLISTLVLLYLAQHLVRGK